MSFKKMSFFILSAMLASVACTWPSAVVAEGSEAAEPILIKTPDGLRCGAALLKNLTACLRIGRIGISDHLAQVESTLGLPAKVIPWQDSEELRSYVHRRSEPKPGSPRTSILWAVRYKNSIVTHAEFFWEGPDPLMTFEEADKTYLFSSLRLGDSSERVFEVLGTPIRKITLPASWGRMEVWTYQNQLSVSICKTFVCGFTVSQNP